MPDDFPLYNDLSVQNYLEYFAQLYYIPCGELASRITEVLALVNLENKRSSLVSELSRGMKQRLSLARTVIHRPTLLLLDEPFGALDVQTKETMQQFLLDLWQHTGVSILMITHDVGEAVFLAQRIYVMTARPGTIQQEVLINLPEPRDYAIKRQQPFRQYQDSITDLLRGTVPLSI